MRLEKPEVLCCRVALKIDMGAALENRHLENSKVGSVGYLATLPLPGAYDAEPTQDVEDPIYLGLTSTRLALTGFGEHSRCESQRLLLACAAARSRLCVVPRL